MSGQVLKFGLVQNIPLNEVDDSEFQIRMEYGDIEGLADDINKRGLLIPILVRPKNGRYELVHGHRRFRAIKFLDQKYIFAVVRELDDKEALLIHGSENIKREDYSPIEEARYYAKCEEYGLSIIEIATKGKKNRSTIRRYVDLLDLPDDIQEKIHFGQLSFSKARELTKLTKDPTVPAGIVKGKKEFQPAKRTDEFYEEIRILSKTPELKDHKAISIAVDNIQEGRTLQEAIELAEKDYNKRKTKERTSTQAPKPEEVAQRLINNLPELKDINDRIKGQYPKLVREILSKGLLKCPYCGESHLVWKCNGKDI